ncbi:MAG: hypothetical protein LC649_03655 [Bacteroidales bacterium]|nr:hypothetical protein [Bacteroidales bacterium]
MMLCLNSITDGDQQLKRHSVNASPRAAKSNMFLLLVLILAFPVNTTLKSQDASKITLPLKVRKGSYIMMDDSLRYFSRDTVIYVNSYHLESEYDPDNRTKIFYDSLRTRASRHTLTKRLHDLVVVSPSSGSGSGSTRSGSEYFDDRSGDTIRRITIERLSPFGRSVNQPAEEEKEASDNFLNRTHKNTREFIIKNYLLFNEGEQISPLLISESERLLRRLPFIDDARIIILPVSPGKSDIHIITKDVYSLGLSVSFNGLKAGRVDIFERNLFGLGHELTFSVPYNYDKDYPPGTGASYKAHNISKSLIDATISYYNAFERKYWDATLAREFLTASTKYAGGLSVRETYTSENLDTLPKAEPLEFNKFDAWAGRSFLIGDDDITRAVIAFRYQNNNVFRRPVISDNSYRALQKYKLYLATLSISTQQFYKTRLIYNYGRSEDIPYGGLLQIGYGKEFNEFKTRDYYSLEFSYGQFNTGFGYIYTRGIISGFTNQSVTEQGLLKLEMDYISNLSLWGRYKNRVFASAEYTTGFARYDDEYLPIGEKQGITGFRNDSVRAAERLTMSLEAITFSPINIYGFKLMFFGYADGALYRDKAVEKGMNGFITGIGAGLRIRNDNLVFNTIEIRVGWFPVYPPYSRIENISVFGEKLLRPPGFNPDAPAIYPYR